MTFIVSNIQVDETLLKKNIGVLIGGKAANLLGITPTLHAVVNFGNRQANAILTLGASTSSDVRVSSECAKTLGLIDGFRYHIRFNPDNCQFTFGPILGIMLSYSFPNENEPFGPLTPYCQEVLYAARQKGIFGYVFTLNDMEPEKNEILGWYYTHNSWQKAWFPLPTCVHNRLSSRSQERTSAVQTKINWLKSKQIPIFNEQFLNKWQVYEVTKNVPKLARFLPKTILYTGSKSLQAMLKSYPVIYLKPSGGSLGRGIYRIMRTNKGYICQSPSMNGSITRNFSKFSSLYQNISARISKSTYLVQQGLSLIRQNGSPVDFRALVQKGRSGKWKVTSIVGRTGAESSIVSNVAKGGTVTNALEALNRSGPFLGGRKPSPSQLKSVALLFAKSIEQLISGHYAELGVDLAVDTNGRIWLLEVNSKPSKTNETLLKDNQKKVRVSVSTMLDYALHLSGFENPRQQKKSQSLKKTILKRTRTQRPHTKKQISNKRSRRKKR